MFDSSANTKTARASLRSKCGKNIFHAHSFCCRFVFNHLPQLIERPTMQARSYLFACSNPVSYVFQVFHNNSTAAMFFSFADNLLGNTVIHVLNVTSFSARDLSQFLSCRLRTVALKTLSRSQKFIPLSAKKSSSEQFSRGGCGQNIFSQINSHSFSCINRQNIGQVKDEVKEPLLSLADEFSFFWKSEVKERLVKSADLKRNLNSALWRKKRQHGFFQGIGSLVKMDRTFFLKNKLFGLFSCLQRSRYFCNCIATHLSSEFRKTVSQGSIRQMVQSHTVPLLAHKSDRGHLIASCNEQILQVAQKLVLQVRNVKFDSNCSFHRKECKMYSDLKTILGGRRFLPGLKALVSAPSKR